MSTATPTLVPLPVAAILAHHDHDHAPYGTACECPTCLLARGTLDVPAPAEPGPPAPAEAFFSGKGGDTFGAALRLPLTDARRLAAEGLLAASWVRTASGADAGEARPC